MELLFVENKEDYALIRAGYEESLKAKKYFSTLKGTVLDRQKPPEKPPLTSIVSSDCDFPSSSSSPTKGAPDLSNRLLNMSFSSLLVT